MPISPRSPLRAQLRWAGKRILAQPSWPPAGQKGKPGPRAPRLPSRFAGRQERPGLRESRLSWATTSWPVAPAWGTGAGCENSRALLFFDPAHSLTAVQNTVKLVGFPVELAGLLLLGEKTPADPLLPSEARRRQEAA